MRGWKIFTSADSVLIKKEKRKRNLRTRGKEKKEPWNSSSARLCIHETPLDCFLSGGVKRSQHKWQNILQRQWLENTKANTEHRSQFKQHKWQKIVRGSGHPNKNVFFITSSPSQIQFNFDESRQKHFFDNKSKFLADERNQESQLSQMSPEMVSWLPRGGQFFLQSFLVLK